MSDVGRLLVRLRQKGVELWIDGGRLKYRAPSGVLTPENVALLRRNRSEVAAFLGRSSPNPPPLVPVESTQPRPLAIAQESCWRLEEFLPGNALTKVFAAWRLTGRLDAGALERTLDEVAGRHETLRTTFREVEGLRAQVVSPDPVHTLEVEDLRGLSRDERVARTIACIGRQTGPPFDLVRGPLVRATLVTIGDGDVLLLVTLHHMVCDPHSLHVLGKEIAAIYPAMAAGTPSPLPALPVQYADFAVWQRRLLDYGLLDDRVSYWIGQLDGGDLPDVGLPTDRPRPARPSFETSQESLILSESVTAMLAGRSQAEGATLFMGLLTALKLVIRHFSGESRVHVATLVAARSHPRLAEMIGLFSNTVLLRTDLGGDPTLQAALRRVRDTVLDAYEYQDLPFEALLAELERSHDLKRDALSRVLFLFTNRLPAERRLNGDVTLQPVDFGKGLLEAAVDLERVTSFDVIVNLTDRPGGIDGSLVYKRSLYLAATIRRAAEAFAHVAEALALRPDRRASDLLLGSVPRS